MANAQRMSESGQMQSWSAQAAQGAVEQGNGVAARPVLPLRVST